MKEYHFFITATENYLKILKILFASLNHWKRQDSKYFVHLYLDSDRILYFREVFQPIATDTFIIQVESCRPYKNLISDKAKMSYTDYIRCLAPKLFPQLDRITILDCDLFINTAGLEDFLNLNIDDYYGNAAIDIPINYKENKKTLSGTHFYNYLEKKQCKTKKYFNLGVCQLNLKKIRLDRKDLLLLQAAIDYPKNLDCKFNTQTIYNYVLRNKVKISDIKFNNTILTMFRADILLIKKCLKEWGYNSEDDLVSKTIIFHFAGPKPWNEYNEEDMKKNNPLFHFAKSIYNQFLVFFKKCV